jgi:hypothetical protein
MQQLLADIEAFCQAFGVSPTAFGIRTMNDPAFVGMLRRGRVVRVDTYQHLMSWMSEYSATHQSVAA